MKINIECGKRLKECRMAAGLSQKEFAELVNYSVQQICYIEKGKRALTEEAAAVFADKLGVRANYLLCIDDVLIDDDKTKELTSIYIKTILLSEFSELAGYEFHSIPESKEESTGINAEGLPTPLSKGSVLKAGNNYFYCSNEILNELTNDVLNYAAMRIEKWLLPKCTKPTPEEMKGAGLSPNSTHEKGSIIRLMEALKPGSDLKLKK